VREGHLHSMRNFQNKEGRKSAWHTCNFLKHNHTRTSPRPAAKILFRGCDIKVSSSRSNSMLPFSAGLISPPSLVNLLSARAILNAKHSTSRYIVLKIIIQSDSICLSSSVMDISHCFNFKIVNLVCRTLRRSAILSLQREFGSSCVCYRRKLGSTTK
jgi:hypothetical protein